MEKYSILSASPFLAGALKFLVDFAISAQAGYDSNADCRRDSKNHLILHDSKISRVSHATGTTSSMGSMAGNTKPYLAATICVALSVASAVAIIRFPKHLPTSFNRKLPPPLLPRPRRPPSPSYYRPPVNSRAHVPPSIHSRNTAAPPPEGDPPPPGAISRAKPRRSCCSFFLVTVVVMLVVLLLLVVTGSILLSRANSLLWANQINKLTERMFTLSETVHELTDYLDGWKKWELLKGYINALSIEYGLEIRAFYILAMASCMIILVELVQLVILMLFSFLLHAWNALTNIVKGPSVIKKKTTALAFRLFWTIRKGVLYPWGPIGVRIIVGRLLAYSFQIVTWVGAIILVLSICDVAIVAWIGLGQHLAVVYGLALQQITILLSVGVRYLTDIVSRLDKLDQAVSCFLLTIYLQALTCHVVQCVQATIALWYYPNILATLQFFGLALVRCIHYLDPIPTKA